MSRNYNVGVIGYGWAAAAHIDALNNTSQGNVTAVFTENYWDGQLSELVDRRGKINAKRRELSKDQTLAREQRDKAIAEFSAKLFTQEELKVLEVGVSNAAYHYLGSAKILGQIGKAFTDALAEME